MSPLRTPDEKERVRLLRSIDRRLALATQEEEIAAGTQTVEQQLADIEATLRRIDGTLRIIVRSRLDAEDAGVKK